MPLTPKFAQVGSGWICVPRKLLKDERKALVAWFQGIAKSTLFSQANLDAAIDLHWAVYPESRPKGRSEEEARKELHFIGDVNRLFTNELIDDINAFDKQAVIKAAKAFRL